MLSKLQTDLKEAQLARDEVKVSTLRLLLSEIKNGEIAKSTPLVDQEIISIIQKEVKKRKEARESFRAGGREELASKEESEAKILEEYLPQALSFEELTKIVESSINELGAKSIADMGKVMSVVMGKAAGRADGATVSAIVKEKLLQ
ncbi:GatB/YqeY domain-containing protein [Candidatus Daviesbacteria bacterium]|nr:GatB/YqeY domain-containing protein [Candidatus Daviesbacteria bacterium]